MTDLSGLQWEAELARARGHELCARATAAREQAEELQAESRQLRHDALGLGQANWSAREGVAWLIEDRLWYLEGDRL